jgi:hypothetical protein
MVDGVRACLPGNSCDKHGSSHAAQVLKAIEVELGSEARSLASGDGNLHLEEAPAAQHTHRWGQSLEAAKAPPPPDLIVFNVGHWFHSVNRWNSIRQPSPHWAPAPNASSKGPNVIGSYRAQFVMQNKTFGPYLVTTHRILLAVLRATDRRTPEPRRARSLTGCGVALVGARWCFGC